MKTAAEAKQAGYAASVGRFMSVNDVIASIGVSRATIYRMIAKQEFPTQHRLTAGRIGWWEKDVETWLQSRPVGGIDSS
ncbi:AlpA family phage regulatory protein [Sphingomonas sp. RHCKR47]|uniref:helix-turn-helix transcriptional regulator n=1 Tax=Sphingomonas citricola TaxID=2862498 RepID=UPI001CA4E551|nr:AlpA family phage regulatory protein [Sphingomonas citricola]MBW6524800.1 AlpA family phage regulatory protein [Sphingomonas citricola]